METTTKTLASFDLSKVEAFAEQVIMDMSATMGSAMTQLGYKLGLFTAMHGAGWITSQQLASKTGTHERYIREWLNCMAAGKYIYYDPENKSYQLPFEHGLVLAEPESPAYLTAGLDIPATVWAEEDKLIAEFKSGKGLGWHQHAHKLFFGTEAFFRTGYKAHLVNAWIPALDGVEDILTTGGNIADVGCGHGASSLLLAKAFPNSHIFGFDYHKESILVARERAREQGISNVTFEICTAENYPAIGYDLICFMDAFHDLGHPSRAAIYALKALNKSGSLMLVEPLAGDRVEDNINPIGRMYYAGSTALCVPHSQHDGGECLGAQAGGAKLFDILHKAGFKNVRTAIKSLVNMVIEAKR